jgi:rubrerythrin
MEEIKQILQRGFTREAQAHLLYFFFADKAEEEMSLSSSAEVVALLKEGATVFREISEQERYHARSYLNTMGGIGNTVQNLQNAIEGENNDILSYTEAAVAARSMGLEEIAQKFERIASVEKRHAALYQSILQRLEEIWVNERSEEHKQAPDVGSSLQGPFK